MRTTITIDDDLYQKALELAGRQTTKTDLISEALRTFVRVQTAKRLAAVGGHRPEMASIPRRAEMERE